MSKSAKSAFKYSFGLDFNGFHHLIGISLTIRMGMDQNLCTIVGRDEAHKSSSQIIINPIYFRIVAGEQQGIPWVSQQRRTLGHGP